MEGGRASSATPKPYQTQNLEMKSKTNGVMVGIGFVFWVVRPHQAVIEMMPKGSSS
jgi:hypothetical protein